MSDVDAPGYQPARILKDYTHTIMLPEDRAAVLNFITGRYWQGQRTHASAAAFAVEEGCGDDEAAPRLAAIERRYLEKNAVTRRRTALVLLPTYSCNLGCTYCYEGKLTQQQAYWTAEDAEKASAASLCFLHDHGCDPADAKLTILGGEPVRVVNITPLAALVGRLAKAGIPDIQVITNGTELAACAADLADAGVTSVMVTIDGPKDLHDRRRPRRHDERSSYDASIEGIASALAAGIAVTVRVNTDSENARSVADLGEQFLERGFFGSDSFAAYIYPVTTDFRTKRKYAPEAELARILADEASRRPILKAFLWELHGLDTLYNMRSGQPLAPKLRYCGATEDQYVMDVNWNIYPCWFGTGKNGFKIGECTSGSDPRFAIDLDLDKQWRSRGPLAVEPCNSCKWALICGSGCSFKSHLRTGSFNKPNCSDFANILNACAPAVLSS